MKFLHLANWGSSNIGNGALIYGAQRLIREDVDAGIVFEKEWWDDYTFGRKKFDLAFVERVNAFDALLVDGAVTFNGREYLKNAGMRFDLPFDLWPKIKRPIIFYGISYRVWPGQEYHNLDKLKQTVAYLLNQSHVLFGVRNDGTKEWLERMIGNSSEKIIEIPDPAVFVPIESSSHPEIQDNTLNVVVSLNNEDAASRFKLPNVKNDLIRAVGRELDVLVSKYDANIIMCPHYFDDYPMFSDLIQEMKPMNAHQHVVSTGFLKVTHAPFFYDMYAKAQLALSMRVHSMSPSIGLGTPVIPIVTQDRMKYFLNDVGLRDIGIDPFVGNFASLLSRQIRTVLDNPSVYRKKFEIARNLMRKRFVEYNKKISTLF